MKFCFVQNKKNGVFKSETRIGHISEMCPVRVFCVYLL